MIRCCVTGPSPRSYRQTLAFGMQLPASMRIQFHLLLWTLSLASTLSASTKDAVAAEEIAVRAERKVFIAASPTWPWIAGHDATIPMPGLCLGVQFSPRWMIEFTGAHLPFDATGAVSLADVGTRYYLGEHLVSPYAMAHVGAYWNNADEGNDRWYPYATAGAGIDVSTRGGLTAWCEAGPALVGYQDVGDHQATLGIFASAGVGYRFGL